MNIPGHFPQNNATLPNYDDEPRSSPKAIGNQVMHDTEIGPYSPYSVINLVYYRKREDVYDQ